MINLKKLLTENTVAAKPQLTESDHVHNGLHKVFGAGEPEISVRRCENVGLGYIKNISEAIKIANTEAQKVAKIYGYRLDEVKGKFIKEDNDFSKLDAQSPESAQAKVTPNEQPHDETNMDEPEEKAEVRIGNEILNLTAKLRTAVEADHEAQSAVTQIQALAKELLSIHGQSEKKPYAGSPIFTDGGHGGL
jgi:hypothetical protein